MNAASIKIVTVTEGFAAIAKAVGGNHVSVKSLVKGSKNLHNIPPKTSMVFNTRQADILIRLGMSQDSWVDGVIHLAKNSAVSPGGIGYIDASSGIKKLEVPTGKIDGQVGDVHIEGNPHYWLDPNNGKIIAKNIHKTLVTIDAKNKKYYDKNLDTFNRKIDKKNSIWKSQLNNIKDINFITYHKVWSYFFKAYDLNCLGELETLPGIPPSAKHLSHLKKKVSNKNIIVLTANYFPQNDAKRFAKSIKANYISTPTNVGEENIKTYTELFDHIIGELTN